MVLGEVVGFKGEMCGALVHNVVPVPGEERSQSNAGSVNLEMHTENAFHPHRPDFVALSCLRQDLDGEAGLRIASLRRAIGLLSIEQREILAEPRFRTDPPPSFNGSGVAVAHGAISGAPEDPDAQVDFHATTPLDAGAKRAMTALREALEAVVDTVYFAPGDLAIVDNRVALHGRTPFSPGTTATTAGCTAYSSTSTAAGLGSGATEADMSSADRVAASHNRVQRVPTVLPSWVGTRPQGLIASTGGNDA